MVLDDYESILNARLLNLRGKHGEIKVLEKTLAESVQTCKDENRGSTAFIHDDFSSLCNENMLVDIDNDGEEAVFLQDYNTFVNISPANTFVYFATLKIPGGGGWGPEPPSPLDLHLRHAHSNLL